MIRKDVLLHAKNQRDVLFGKFTISIGDARATAKDIPRLGQIEVSEEVAANLKVPPTDRLRYVVGYFKPEDSDEVCPLGSVCITWFSFSLNVRESRHYAEVEASTCFPIMAIEEGTES